MSTEDFVRKAIKIHGNNYNYRLVNYQKAINKIQIICEKENHGIFEQTPNSHLKGRGCPRCNKRYLLTTEEFIERAKEKHGHKYDYSLVIYKGMYKKVKIKCRAKGHPSFIQIAKNHLNGTNCPKCALLNQSSTLRSNIESFVKKSNIVHSNKYTYSNALYKNAISHISVTCKIHGDFNVTPNNHLRGCGCPKCATTQYSKIAIKWIEEKAKSLRMKNVQHALNGGEYKIPEVGKVDGYHAPTKTVFEFHGDAFHGNPERYKLQSKPHPFSNKTTLELYTETFKRDERIRNMGYNLITIWESDYLGRSYG